MKKHTLSVVLAAALLTGCAESGGSVMQTESRAETQMHSAPDPFAAEESPANRSDDPPSYRCEFPAAGQQQPVAFSDEISLPFTLDIEGCDAEYRALVFCDGILQDVKIMQNGEMLPGADFTLKDREINELAAVFRPVTAGTAPAVLSLSVLYDPSFAPESAQTQYGHHHRLMINMNASLEAGFADAKDDIAAAEPVPVSESVQKKHLVQTDGGTKNQLADGTFFERENCSGDTSSIGIRRGDSVLLRLAGGALTGTWRVSAYCDHQQVAAFDGRHYLDMTADAQTMTEYTVPMDAFPVPEAAYSTVYFIAAPLDRTHELMKTHPLVLVRDES